MIDDNYFDARLNAANATLTGDEVLLASVHAEDTDFVRFNHARVRQAGSVRQASMSIDLIRDRRHAAATVTLSADPSLDDSRISDALARLREQLSSVPDDPYLLINTEPTSTERRLGEELPSGDQAIDAITTAAGDRDLVGIYASGSVASGFGNSLGQRNWHETATFDFDWTLYLEADKAVKSGYAGFTWDQPTFSAKMSEATHKLDALARPTKELGPGEYRCLLTPAALREVMELLTWNGFGLRSRRTSQSSLMRLVTGDAELAPAVNVAEHTTAGTAANFQEQGFLRPDRVPLITEGRSSGALVSPRSAAEYDVPANGASAYESPESLAMAGGGLDDAEALDALGTGLFIGNLHYTNYSDLPACRVTGMTRFATFWVEDGEIVSPIKVLRFDDTVYNLLGAHLIDLTRTPEFLADNSTYFARDTLSMTVPGALVESMRFTL